MINILSSRTIFHENRYYDILKKYINKKSKICVIAFSFFDNAFLQENYEKEYSRPEGKWYLHIVEPLSRFEVQEDNISWIIYHVDSKESAIEKIENADIIFLPGGAPDRFMDRLNEYELVPVLQKQENKIFMGPSAGTMIQFDWFHISKDRDYHKFSIHDGLGFVKDFGVEVHFNRRKQQKKSMRKVSHMHPRPIHALYDDGLMVIENGNIIYNDHGPKYYEKGKRIKK
ncbi:Type 1 glutamine amidotransferase-like domain-containing protein [Acholeplasma equifetale]|uniref:Type 1 glutamine amidotransferase-like domain-containing protein n=1 Tax=Acholeplasma equifetale TaxID=264634 RepID=UPI0009FEEB20|nr:Type 1 glutamine amidotransferase-like domain-containing protein [Acholeplasma equifetale]